MKNSRKFGFLAMLGMLVTFSACNKDEVLKSLEVAFGDSEVSVAENADPITITLEFPEESKVNAEVSLMIEGTAVYGTDYTTSPAVESDQLTFEVAKGDASVSFTFTPIDDEVYTEDLTVTATLIEAKGVDLGENSSVEVTITDDGDTSNETIDLGDGEAFNMDNFLTSFEQIFNTSDQFFWTFDHTVIGGEVVSSMREATAFGSYFYPFSEEKGPFRTDPVQYIEHKVEDGVIVASDVWGYSAEEADLYIGCTDFSYVYTYDEEGYIASVKMYSLLFGANEESFEYNDDGKIITKTQDGDGDFRLSNNAFAIIIEEPSESVETIAYNSDGTIASITAPDGCCPSYTHTEFTYANGKVSSAIRYDGVDNTGAQIEAYAMAYDSEGRITEVTTTYMGASTAGEAPGDVMEFKYTNSTGILEYGEGGMVYEREVYAYGGKYVAYEEYDFEGDPSEQYYGQIWYYGDYVEAEPRFYREDGPGGPPCQEARQYVEKIEAYEGADELIGYATVGAREFSGKKLEESVYGADGTLLYSLDFSENAGDYCNVEVTDEVAGETVSFGTMMDDIGELYSRLFNPNGGFCQD